LFNQWNFVRTISIANYLALPWFFGALIGGGAIAGDLLKSFFKRRFNISSGRSWIPFDQVDYLLGGLLAGLPFYAPGLIEFILIIAFGFVLHLLFKLLGFILKISDKAI
jgi:CDP-2,3-bis-(O-geranylgeranyl)-sn-glycerol synthase